VENLETLAIREAKEVEAVHYRVETSK